MSQGTPSIVSVRCNHCGAPLEVSAGARFLTCSYCNAQLEIHRSGGAVYTEVMEQIHQRTERIERDVREIKRQNAIEQLDREWEARRTELMVRNKNGSMDVPTEAGGIIAGVVGVVGGIAWMIITAGAGAPGFFPLIGLLVIVAGLITAFTQTARAQTYKREESAHRTRREALLREGNGEQATGG